MNSIFLSIIVPVYNVEQFLRECLDSIARLKSIRWEAILIDDGSSDSSGLICDEYAAEDSRFKVIHQKNAGVSAARNAGLEVIKGKWVWFVDSDDVVDGRCVDSICRRLNMDLSVDYVMFDLEKFDGKSPLQSGILDQTINVKQEKTKNVFLLKYICSYHCTLWYRRDIIDNFKIRFTLGIRNSEDGEFMAKYLMLMKTPVKVDYSIYYYRMREGSAMHLASAKRNIIEDVPVVFFNLLNWMEVVGQKVEPWLDYWFLKMIQNLLVNASQYRNLNKRKFQDTIKSMLDACASKGFPFVNDKRMKLARRSVSAYFLINKIYLKLKGL